MSPQKRRKEGGGYRKDILRKGGVQHIAGPGRGSDLRRHQGGDAEGGGKTPLHPQAVVKKKPLSKAADASGKRERAPQSSRS